MCVDTEGIFPKLIYLVISTHVPLISKAESCQNERINNSKALLTQGLFRITYRKVYLNKAGNTTYQVLLKETENFCGNE